MTDDGEALHAAILADPDDDLVRLAYADWLDEQGRAERAEFIRVQIELAAGLPGPEELTIGTPLDGDPRHNCRSCLRMPAGDHCRHHRLKIREAALLLTHAGEWFPLPGKTFHASPRRGFIDEVEAGSAGLEAHLPSLLLAHPITRVRTTDRFPARWSSFLQATFYWYLTKTLNDEDYSVAIPRHWVPWPLRSSPVWETAPLRLHSLPSYDTLEDANDAMSKAWLVWADAKNRVADAAAASASAVRDRAPSPASTA